jgi:hypothetical protein
MEYFFLEQNYNIRFELLFNAKELSRMSDAPSRVILTPYKLQSLYHTY